MGRLGSQFSMLVIAMSLTTASIAGRHSERNDPAEQGTGATVGQRDGLGADIKAYLTSPLQWRRRDWFELAGAVGAIGAAYSADGRTREHFDPGSPGVTPDTHDTEDALPAFAIFAGTLIGAFAAHDDDGRLEARSMLEAAAFGTATSYVVKSATGRLRPYETTGRSGWREGGDSFPSVHAAAAFSIGTVFAESGNDRYRWIRRFIGYGVALGTAHRRLDHRAHWGSDTVAGAAIGIASARFVLARRDPRARRARAAVIPTDDGIALAYTVPLD